MKNIITLSLISASLLIAANPIHDNMDTRLKGQSFGGTLPDNQASNDGLGVLPLQHHTGTTDINNELLVQKVFNRIVHTETDKTKTINIRNAMSLGVVGTATDINLLNNAGTTLSYPAGTLTSCKEILNSYPNSTTGIFNLKNIGDTYCDMDTDGGGWTQVINLDTNDGAIRGYNDTGFWRSTSTLNTASSHYNGDYKSAALDKTLATTSIMIVGHIEGSIKGIAIYDLLSTYQNRSFYQLLDLSNTTITGNKREGSFNGVSYILNTNRPQTLKGDIFFSFTNPLVMNKTSGWGAATNYNRIATTLSNTNYAHTFAGIAGQHYQAGWGTTYYEAAPISPYCSMTDYYGSNHSSGGSDPFQASCHNEGLPYTDRQLDFAIFVK